MPHRLQVGGDHNVLHPDLEANEIWISCNAGFEVVMFALDLLEVSARIPMPSGGRLGSIVGLLVVLLITVKEEF